MPSLISSEDAAAELRAACLRWLANAAEPRSANDPSIPCCRQLASIPEAARKAALEQCRQGDQLHWIAYRPQRECFFHGDDPLNSARQTPGLMWGRVLAPEPLPSLGELDTYSCLLGFDLLTNAPREELDQYYRYLPDQVEITAVPAPWLVKGQDEVNRPGNASPAAKSGSIALGGRRGRLQQDSCGPAADSSPRRSSRMARGPSQSSCRSTGQTEPGGRAKLPHGPTFKRRSPKPCRPATTHCCWHGSHGLLRTKPSSRRPVSSCAGSR